MRMAPILATVFFMSAAHAPTVLADETLLGNKVAVPIGETKGAVIEGPLKGAVVEVPRAVGAIGTTTGQEGAIVKTPTGLERYVGAKVMIDHDGKGIVSDPPEKADAAAKPKTEPPTKRQ
jgi:hypothetical protein